MVFLAFAEGNVQLLPDGTILIHIALILGMIWILNRTFFRPFNRVIESREKSRGGRSTEAEAILRQAEEKRTRFDAKMLETRSESYELIENERREAVAQREQKIEVAKEEIAAHAAREYEDLERQTVSARAAIAEEAEKMAEKISSNILKVA